MLLLAGKFIGFKNPFHSPSFMVKVSILFSLVFFSFGIVSMGQTRVTVFGKVVDKSNEKPLPSVNITLNTAKDSTIVNGAVTDEKGNFKIEDIRPQKYYLNITYVGYRTHQESVYIGEQSENLNIGKIKLEENSTELSEVTVSGRRDMVGNRMDKKIISADQNITQSGGSMLQALRNLPGVTTDDDKVKLRGSDKVLILIDGRQSAVTGIDNQGGLDDIPASDIDKIEIINNPSARHEANGSAGIINIITKKEKRTGLNGELGISAGLGGLWKRKDNYPEVSPQSLRTPKISPSASINYRTEKINLFAKVDDRYGKVQHSNRFTTRTYKDGSVVKQQFKRDKEANHIDGTTGMDWFIDGNNTLTLAGSFTLKSKTNDGEEPVFNEDLSERKRLWTMTEDDHKNTAAVTANYEHRFEEAGHKLEMNLDYSLTHSHKKYNFINILPHSEGTDAFDYQSKEHIYSFGLDYTRPLKYGKLETGAKIRYRNIPSDMDFMPGKNSVIDPDAGGWAEYKELIPAVYANYDVETENWIAELGLRMEYMHINSEVNPNHPVYESRGYHYFEPFVNAQVGYKFNENNRLSLFYNRRVDRPTVEELRIFPKYDDAEILEIGNPGLIPQFTNEVELGFKTSWEKGYLFSAAYHRIEKNTIQQISTGSPDNDLIYDIFQNAGKSYFTGVEMVFTQNITDGYDLELNGNIYRHQINAFTVENLYPVPQTYTGEEQTNVSGNVKLNNNFDFSHGFRAQLTGIYIAPDRIPQGKEGQRFSLDLGLKKSIQAGQGEIYFNATDLLNTMRPKKTVTGEDFSYTEVDYKETQIFRIGYNYKF